MLDTSPTNLSAELRIAEAFREDHMLIPRELMEAYSGRQHNQNIAREAYFENHAAEWLSLVGPRLIYDNPSVRITVKRPGSVIGGPDGQPLAVDDVALAVQYDMNQWIRSTDLRETLILSMYDDAFAWGPLLTVPGPSPGLDPTEPNSSGSRVYRLSPTQVGIDPRAPDPDRARFVYHHVVRDREDLLEEAESHPNLGWRVAAIRGLGTTEQLPSLALLGLVSGQLSNRLGPERTQVIYYEVWVSEEELPEATAAGGRAAGLNGTIHTLAGDEAGPIPLEIRDPRPYWGPPWGPYDLGGIYPVPDDPYRLSPLVATHQQARHYDLIARAIQRNVEKYKKLIWVDAANPKMARSVASDPSLFVVPMAGITQNSVVQTEYGGLTNQMIVQSRDARERLDRNSGIDAARRGAPTGVSATEADIADRAGETRLAFMQRQFRAKVRRVLRTVAWYMVFEQLGPGAFEQLDIEVEAMSMDRLSEPMAQQKALMLLQLQTQLGQALFAMPWIDWRSTIQDIGQAFDQPDFESRFNFELAEKMAQLRVAQEGAPPPEPPGPGPRPSPRSPAPPNGRAGGTRGQVAGATAASRQGVQGRPSSRARSTTPTRQRSR